MDYVTSFIWKKNAEDHTDLRYLPLGEMISLFLEWL